MRLDLPETIDPMRLAKTGIVLSGGYDLHQFERIQTSSEFASDTQVVFRLEFSRLNFSGLNFFGDNENCLYGIIGNVETSLPQVCQRCMQSMRQAVNGSIKMAIIEDEAKAEHLPADTEAFIDRGVPVKLQDFIEDELLLAMPLIPLHKERECSAANKYMNRPGEKKRAAKENPFVELKHLKLNN